MFPGWGSVRSSRWIAGPPCSSPSPASCWRTRPRRRGPRQALTLPNGVKSEDTREFIAAIGALAHALRHEMRRTDPLPELGLIVLAWAFQPATAAAKGVGPAKQAQAATGPAKG